MLLTDDSGIQNAGGRLQRINRRINTQLYNGTGKHCCRIQMSKCRCRCRVRQVIRRHINCLNRCDGTILGGCDTLLQSAHFRLQCRLIPYRRGHTSQQSGYLRTCLGETENIINKQQHILTALITEIFCHCQTGQTDAHSCPGGLIHLSEYHGCLIDNPGFFHFIIQVIAFSGTLAYTGK